MDKAIGIDLGGTNIKGALVNSQGQIIRKQSMPTLAEEGPKAVIDRMIRIIRDLADGFQNNIQGVGLGIPGQPEEGTGVVLYAPNLRWRDIPLGEKIKGQFDWPIFLENDANAAAWGEFLYGAGRGAHNMVAITIGTGIGAGIIIEGKLYRGSAWSAGELGHTILWPAGPLCTCGNRGCLETMTAAPALVRLASARLKEGCFSNLAQYDNLEVRDIFREGEQGDRLASEVIETMAHNLGMGMANIINILNPDRVVIGGGVAQAGDILLKKLKAKILEFALPVPAKNIEVAKAQLGNDAGSIGAAALIFHP